MPLPVADEGIAGFLQRSENRRKSVSPNDSPGTARRYRLLGSIKQGTGNDGGAHKTVLKKTDLGICLTGLETSIQKRILRKAKSQSTFLTSFGICYYLWESVNQVQLQYLNELFQRLINLFSSHRISSGLKQFPTSPCLLLREQF